MSESVTGAASPESPTRPTSPVRTRWLEDRRVETGDAPLPPTLSSGTPYRRPPVRAERPMPPSTAPSSPAETPSAAAQAEAMPWEEAAPTREPGSLSEPMSAADQPFPLAGTGTALEDPFTADSEPWADEAPTAAAEIEIEGGRDANLQDEVPVEELELIAEDEPELLLEESLETRFLEPLPEGAVPVQAPLSPWDIAESEDDEERARQSSRAARARAEWEALGEALAASIGGEDASVFESAMQALAEGIATESIEDNAGVTREIVEIADRIAWFAARLRSDGYRAITNAQARGDRLDIALAALAAGFLAGQTE